MEAWSLWHNDSVPTLMRRMLLEATRRPMDFESTKLVPTLVPSLVLEASWKLVDFAEQSRAQSSIRAMGGL